MANYGEAYGRGGFGQGEIDFSYQKGGDGNINALLYSEDNSQQDMSQNSHAYGDMNQKQGEQRPANNAQKIAQMQRMKEQQKQQYLAKRTIRGERNQNQIQEEGNSLEKMKLDRNDQDSAHFDPFFSSRGKLDLELKSQIHMMNKQNTMGNAMWTPEMQRAMEEKQAQNQNGLNEIEEIQDDGVRYYKPYQMGFTEAEQKQQDSPQKFHPLQQVDEEQDGFQEMYYNGKKSSKYGNNLPFEHENGEGDMSSFQKMNVVEVQDGVVRSKTKKEVEVIVDQGEEPNNANFDPQVQFEANLIDEQTAAGGKKKKKKKKKKMVQEEGDLEDPDQQQQMLMQQQAEEQQALEEHQRKLKELEEKSQRLKLEEERLEQIKQQEIEEQETQKRQQDEQQQLTRRQKQEEEIRKRELIAKQRQYQQDEEEEEKKGPQPPYYIKEIQIQNISNPEQKEAHQAFLQKLLNPFTQIEELKSLFMNPLPPMVGQVQCTITRHKSGFNRLFPKYTLSLSEGSKFLLNGKKRSGNKTSNYMITIDQDKLKKSNKGYLGKVRSNFLGTEFYLFDSGTNEKKAKDTSSVREQHGVVSYETNVLGSKGPRRMRVLLPKVDREAAPHKWKSMDKNYSMMDSYKGGNQDNLMLFFNKPPKWNDQVQAFVLNFNGRVDKASVKNFQLIDEYDDNRIYMQFGRIGKHNFNMDVAFPFSLFQAFGIALSSFDFKFACE